MQSMSAERGRSWRGSFACATWYNFNELAPDSAVSEPRQSGVNSIYKVNADSIPSPLAASGEPVPEIPLHLAIDPGRGARQARAKAGLHLRLPSWGPECVASVESYTDTRSR